VIIIENCNIGIMYSVHKISSTTCFRSCQGWRWIELQYTATLHIQDHSQYLETRPLCIFIPMKQWMMLDSSCLTPVLKVTFSWNFTKRATLMSYLHHVESLSHIVELGVKIFSTWFW